MPIIEVTMAEGRDSEQIRRLIHELSHAASRSIDVPVENIRLIIRETPLTHFAAGDVTTIERREGRISSSSHPPPNPVYPSNQSHQGEGQSL
ncbi:tautomerase family protein [Lipingzhangella sp. LS1_29]|uniref:Tautomerase family protein n=1 Tax=Lipingzhangella rawalii TaxID=2055835 RepID=A0ABU2HB81_9ACTN|nr:tautomerase family protein [Lipingzhangella rawalii]MDS1272590.1 tautomerase family protein [Lipingzhangella rawalii]